MGATPRRTFTTVVVPLCRQALLAAFLLVFVFTLGSNIIAQVLGRPQHWTLAVVISDQATMSANVPFAAAIAMFLTLISLTVVGVVSFAGSRSWMARERRRRTTPPAEPTCRCPSPRGWRDAGAQGRGRRVRGGVPDRAAARGADGVVQPRALPRLPRRGLLDRVVQQPRHRQPVAQRRRQLAARRAGQRHPGGADRPAAGLRRAHLPPAPGPRAVRARRAAVHAAAGHLGRGDARVLEPGRPRREDRERDRRPRRVLSTVPLITITLGLQAIDPRWARRRRRWGPRPPRGSAR